MKIHYLQHVPFEGPGYIKQWAYSEGHELTATRLFNSTSFPEPGSIDFLIVMGGPMGVYDENKYSWLKEEKQFIETCIIQKKNVLGICLGAQLIAEVLGAKVATMPEKEIGWFPVDWTEQARNHPRLDTLTARQVVLHWHGDMFQLPDGALDLASSRGCKNQAFLADDHILGLQFHLEMTQEGLGRLIEHSGDELTGGRYIQQPEEMLNSDCFKENHRTLHQLLENFCK